jgi:hypothetical protein
LNFFVEFITGGDLNRETPFCLLFLLRDLSNSVKSDAYAFESCKYVWTADSIRGDSASVFSSAENSSYSFALNYEFVSETIGS